MGRKKEAHWDLKKLSDKDLASIPLIELQRIVNKRWAYGKQELLARAQDELQRRNPKNKWKCLRCGNEKYHEQEIRVSGGFMQSFLGWEMNKYHAIICNYCGKTEFYSVQIPSSEKAMGLLGN